MDKEIKERIAAINSGIIPEGYKKTKVGIVPVEWGNKKLQKVCSKIIAGATPSTKIGDYWNGNIRWMSSGEINKKIICDTDTKITQLGYDSCSTKTIPEKCVLIALAGQGKTRGMVAYNLVPICTNQSLASLIPNDIFYLYLYYYLDSQYQNLRSVSSGDGSRGGLNLEIISNYNIIIPPLPEQQKIAEILSTQDKLIELQEKKIDQLKELKKAYLQKMFPKKGSKYPELRFKGFTDPWEQRKLGEIATFINGRAYSQDELLSSGKYKVLRVGNFYTNDSWYYSDMELEDKYYAENDDLLYTWSATFGPHIWRGDKVIYHYHIWKIELSQHLEKRFAVQLLEQDKVAILSDKNGSTMIHITKAGMEEKTVLIPQNIDEQVKIGTFLNNLDSLINLHQRKSEQEKQKKKALMQLLLTGIVRTK